MVNLLKICSLTCLILHGLRMPFNLVMATRALDVEGFPALLCEMLWRANFTYAPEYSVYAKGHGPGLVDYVATVHIKERFVAGATAHFYEAAGTSEEMAVQAVAYKVMAALCAELPVLEGWPFTYFPIHEDDLINNFEYPTEEAPLFGQHMVELARSLDRAYRCFVAELWTMRARYNQLQHEVEFWVRRGRVNRGVLYGGDPEIPHESATSFYRFPPVHGSRVPHEHRRNARCRLDFTCRTFHTPMPVKSLFWVLRCTSLTRVHLVTPAPWDTIFWMSFPKILLGPPIMAFRPPYE